MGLPGLYSYITSNPRQFLETRDLHDTYLIIDGVNIYSEIIESVDRQGGIFGGQYDIFHDAVEKFFDSLALCKIKPIVFLDGLGVLSRVEHFRAVQDKIKDSRSAKRQFAKPELLRTVFLEVMESKNITYVQTLTDDEEIMAALAKALDCPVLSKDGDFFLYGSKFIPLNLRKLTPIQQKDGEKYLMPCKIYNVEKFCKHFHDVDQSLLQLASMILGNKNGRSNLDSNIMKPFFEQLERRSTISRAPSISHRRLEKTFNWLSMHPSMEAAVTALLGYIDIKHRRKILDVIEKSISKFGAGLSLALNVLGFGELESKILEENKKSFTLKSKVEGLDITLEAEREEMAEGKIQDVKGEIDDNYQYTEEEVIDLFPKWLIDDYMRGKVRRLPMELFMFSTELVKPSKDESSYPPVSRISLPIVKSIYSLICSLRGNDENELELYTVKDGSVSRENITVKTSSISFKDIKELELSERKRIIDEVLGVDGVDFITDLPDCWRLYVMTIIFWMRQEILPQRNKVHLYSVILAMLLGIIDDEIGLMRCEETFFKKFGDDYKVITGSGMSDEVKSGSSLGETMKLISRDECIAASPFFISQFKMDSLKRQASLSEDEENGILNPFLQLHNCVKHSIILNSMLDCPYTSVPLHKVYNGLFLYKTFKLFSRQDDIDSYLYETLGYSKTIVEVFMILKDTLLSIIGKDI